MASAVVWPTIAEARGVLFKSPELALEQGLGAMRGGHLEIAIPALEAATQAEGATGLLAQFYLARIFADNSHGQTDHAKAYMLFQRIADEHADIDPDDDRMTPFVSKSLIALAFYLRNGVSDISLKPNPSRAAQYMHHAATVFSDEDAQFELAKLFLTGDGIEPDVRRAVHWFSVLTQRSHAGAQAFLADLHWRGRHVPKDHDRALALATIAVENAPSTERIWIEDIYQKIFCGISEGQRADASSVVADWRHKYGRQSEERIEFGLGTMMPTANRTCSDGRSVIPAVRNGGLPANGDRGMRPTGLSQSPPGLKDVTDVKDVPRAQ